ncbi:DNA/RNA polymerase [Coemansia reversa NRRL 1564]|uniref:DNA/RNA polymerase n=1 Tax=Coemansia reversa (strain ATCC 12441 / NRRL 1564) TaxID=763665 RepID=A0A2G5B6V3_COERN|nr:DNA/RNA polymerase [Coemansia reversa NRRL 1564]|eukprot:PIA14738.1 DNA/RNA polymerase [Coemansia reversa NRRL 1564]
MYDRGPRGKLRNRRMVQGNSESPAIVQAFILHVLEGVSGLQSRLLAYIDNIYIKSTDDDMDAHIADSQALLAPFYKATGKVHLSKNDIEALREPWEALKRALLDVKTLFIPPPGAPLVLRTDAAGAGVGAVLLAQRTEDPNDLAPVSYFSHAFGGKQGHKHSTWHEACAVYEAVKYFYPYLDGCINLCIETDCGIVVSLFSHKTTSDTDPLAQFKLGLTELGVKKHMIVHRHGVDQ